METIQRWITQLTEYEFLNNSLLTWVLAIVVAFVGYSILMFVRRFTVKRIERFATRTKSDIDDLIVRLINNTSGWFILVMAISIGTLLLAFSSTSVVDEKTGSTMMKEHPVPKFRHFLLVIAFTIQGMIWGYQLVEYAIAEFIRRRQTGEGENKEALLASMGVAKFLLLLAVYAVIILVALDNAGIDVTAMVTTLGIGGIAVALALQNVLSDLFASLSIVLDKPFVVGDFIIVGDKMGAVERIGVKTTRVRALSGEQLIFANTDLLSSRIQNFKRMNERRVVFAVGIIYQTPIEKITIAQEIIKQAIESKEKTRFDRCHFKSFGDFSLNYEAVYYVLDRDYAIYMNVQQAINVEIFKRFAEEGIDFAYPTQLVYVSKEGGGEQE